MLRAIVGTARVLAEPVAAVWVLEYCGEPPLAIRIAGARLVARPSWRIAALAARLAVEGNRLDELSVEDIGVRARFAEDLILRPVPPAGTAARLRAGAGRGRADQGRARASLLAAAKAVCGLPHLHPRLTQSNSDPVTSQGQSRLRATR